MRVVMRQGLPRRLRRCAAEGCVWSVTQLSHRFSKRRDKQRVKGLFQHGLAIGRGHGDSAPPHPPARINLMRHSVSKREPSFMEAASACHSLAFASLHPLPFAARQEAIALNLRPSVCVTPTADILHFSHRAAPLRPAGCPLAPDGLPLAPGGLPLAPVLPVSIVLLHCASHVHSRHDAHSSRSPDCGSLVRSRDLWTLI